MRGKSWLLGLVLAIAITAALSFTPHRSVMAGIGNVVTPVVHAQSYGYASCPEVFAAFAAAEAQYGYAFELDGYYFTGEYTPGDHYQLWDYYGHVWGPHGEDGGLWSIWCYDPNS